MSNKRSIDVFKEYYLTISVMMMICYYHFCYKEQAHIVIGGFFPTLLFLWKGGWCHLWLCLVTILCLGDNAKVVFQMALLCSCDHAVVLFQVAILFDYHAVIVFQVAILCSCDHAMVVFLAAIICSGDYAMVMFLMTILVT